MKKKILGIVVLIVALTACNTAKEGTKTKTESNITDKSKVIMVIGNEKLTELELDKAIARYPLKKQAILKTAKGRAALINELSVRKILTQEAVKEGIEKTDSFKNTLKKAKNDILIAEVVNKNASKGVTVTEGELKKIYEKSKLNFKMPEEVKVAHILISVNAKMTTDQKKAAQKKAEKILKEVTPQNFAQMAKKYSMGPTASGGGELGWINRQSVVKPFGDAAFTGTIGKVYGKLVKTRFGYHIILIEKKKPAGYLTYAQLKPTIEKDLMNNKIKKNYSVWIEGLKKEYIKK